MSEAGDDVPPRLVTGVAHVHTAASYDGVLSVRRIAARAARAGWNFVLITEHSDGLTERAFSALDEECRSVSSDRLLMFPSIEFTCERNVHVLGYGAGFMEHALAPASDVARAIRQRGGLAILAHPRKYVRRDPAALTMDLLQCVSGVEVWNSKLAYDGPWVAPVRNYDYLYPGKVGFCGQDAHYERHFSSLVIRMRLRRLTRVCLLAQLASGKFTMSNGFFTLSPQGPAMVGPTAALTRAADAAMMLGLTHALRLRDLVKHRSRP